MPSLLRIPWISWGWTPAASHLCRRAEGSSVSSSQYSVGRIGSVIVDGKFGVHVTVLDHGSNQGVSTEIEEVNLNG